MPRHRTAIATVTVIAALAAHPAWAAGTVEVNFVKPDEFADIGFGRIERDRTLKALGDFLRTLGAALPDGQVLKLDVLDLDLAGTVWPNGRSGQDIRVLRGGADWPHMTLHYSLSAGGGLLKAGDAKLADMNYLMSSVGAQWRQSELGYEKHMVQQWFDQTFVAR